MTKTTLTRNKGTQKRITLNADNSTRVYKMLFWNVLNKDLSIPVKKIADFYDLDFLVLGELKKADVPLYKEELGKLGFSLRTTPQSKVKIFDRFETQKHEMVKKITDFSEYSQFDRSTSLIYTLNGQKILIVGVHLFSIASMSDQQSRKGFAMLALKVIEHYEKEHKIDKTIVIGDLNMNPYEPGMIDFFGLHATMCKNTALAGIRDIGGEKKRYFYNPSWEGYSNIGNDISPPGTYFFEERYGTYLPYWNILDQVIIRPELVENNRGFKIISSAGEEVPNLLNEEGKPDKVIYSDHLPILYSFEI
ncbi:hypothetical protein [Bacillus sp. AFS029533]|uniref:hypothetical protein n=1 Tax=Bacillus sp. AFS029533 TaxID=2033494 RepID=UPI000BFDF234|nr:hypothetical protein [Bacillus sp. AFS029533]PGZ92185.1 hypothetical protein COE53_12540 [Bacillus sp. AFS029533]